MAHFNNYDRALVIFSLLSYLTDIATDIALIVYFLSLGHAVWGALTLSFVALSAILMQVFSFHWHVTDRTLTWRTFVVHILFLAPTHRYIAVYRRGMKSRKTGRMEDLEAAYRGLNDISILRLFETFLESAPQLILQLYIVLSDLDNYNTLLGFSLFFSLTSVAWAMTSYMDALHLAYQKLYKRSWMAMFMHVLWQSGMVTARVVSIVLFTTVFQAYVAIPLAVHFVIMMVWITRLNPEFGTTKCERRLFTVISSVIHIFCFLNLKDGMARYRMAFFYILVLVETAMYMTVWYMCKTFVGPIWFDVTAFSVVFGSFAFGTLCMLLYYGCCHSSGPAPLRKKPQEFLKPAHHSYRPTGIHTPSYAPRKEQEPEKQQFTKPVRQPIFDVSTTSARINQWLSASLDLSKEGLTDNPDRMLDPAIRTRNHGDWVAGADGLSLTGSGANGSAGRSLLDGSRNMSGLQVSSTGDQSHLGRSALATSLQERSQHSIPDQNLIEMFSQIRHDPSFVSNTSMSDSFFDQTRRQSGGKDALSPQQNSTVCQYSMDKNR
ncbi:XKR6-like protein [Mya arenaria]|uniref:XK-related protein n=1 Tax=Mya arenaria TaxID=6604 RepID=A0ABY7FL22_MYAAR|nr:XKR6-like protein [Mya arenaria]